MFNEPSPGDIWVQTAQIQTKNNGKVTLAISDENGTLSKTTELAEELFKAQFFPDPNQAGNFIKKVQIEEMHQDDNSYLIAILNANGGKIKGMKISQRVFKEQFHLPQI